MRRGISCLALLTALLTALLAGRASAHTGVLGALAPFLESGALVGGSTTWGIVLSDEGTFHRVCDEAPAMAANFHLRVPLADGGEQVLVGGGPGLLASADRGCSYQGRSLMGASDATAAVLAGGRIYVATGRPGYPNAVFVSDDLGQTFAPTGLSGTASPLWELAASPDGSVLVVSGDDLDLERPLLLGSVDQGAHWSAGSVDLAAFARVRVLSVDTAGEEVLVGAEMTDESAWLLSLDASLTERERVASPRALSHALRMDGALFAVADTEALLRRDASGGAFVASEVLVKCLFLVGDTLWACGSTTGPLGGVHFASSSDGVDWLPELFDLEIRERVCPEGSAGHDACLRYQDAGPAGDGGSSDGGEDDGGAADEGEAGTDAGAFDAGASDEDAGPAQRPRPAPSCAGCASSVGGPGPWLLLWLFSARRACRAWRWRRS